MEAGSGAANDHGAGLEKVRRSAARTPSSASPASRSGGIPLDPLPWAARNCSILLADVAGFGDRRRDDGDRRVIREVLYRLLPKALEASHVSWETCYHEDRGDGVLVVIPPGIPTVSVVDPMIAQLAARLRRHNRRAGDPIRIQLRVALHVGPVYPDPDGVSGESLIYAARMLEAPVLKEALAETRADLAFVASAFVYDTVIKHAPGLVDPATYQRVESQVKESKINAWMHLAGGSVAPIRSRSETAQQQSTGRAVTVFNGEVRIDGDLVLGDKIEYGG